MNRLAAESLHSERSRRNRAGQAAAAELTRCFVNSHRRPLRRQLVDHRLQLPTHFGHDGIAQLVAHSLRADRDCFAYLNYRVKRLVNCACGR